MSFPFVISYRHSLPSFPTIIPYHHSHLSHHSHSSFLSQIHLYAIPCCPNAVRSDFYDYKNTCPPPNPTFSSTHITTTNNYPPQPSPSQNIIYNILLHVRTSKTSTTTAFNPLIPLIHIRLSLRVSSHLYSFLTSSYHIKLAEHIKGHGQNA